MWKTSGSFGERKMPFLRVTTSAAVRKNLPHTDDPRHLRERQKRLMMAVVVPEPSVQWKSVPDEQEHVALYVSSLS